MQSTQCVQRILWTLALASLLIRLNGQTLNTIYSFGHNELGCKPQSGVVIGAHGELYGTLPHGGGSGLGLVYELSPPWILGSTWTETALHSLHIQNGAGPPTGSTIGSDGSLYGAAGQFSDGGTVFRLTPPAAGRLVWPEQLLWAFTNPSANGSGPSDAPIFGPDKALYGTTLTGGTNTSGAVYHFCHPLHKALNGPSKCFTTSWATTEASYLAR